MFLTIQAPVASSSVIVKPELNEQKTWEKMERKTYVNNRAMPYLSNRCAKNSALIVFDIVPKTMASTVNKRCTNKGSPGCSSSSLLPSSICSPLQTICSLVFDRHDPHELEFL